MDDDPGWPPLWKSLVSMVVPGMAARRAMRADDGLLALRSIFLAYVLSLGAIAVVSIVVSSGVERSDARSAAVLVAAWAIAAQVLARVVPKPLDCAALGDSYRRRFFLRVALYESAALVAFVAVILTAHPELYLIGGMSTVVGLARTAPTEANLERDQQELHLAGCPGSLVAAVRRPPSPRTSGP